jgi:hypothetical protein
MLRVHSRRSAPPAQAQRAIRPTVYIDDGDGFPGSGANSRGSADAWAVPSPDAAFDVVVPFETLEHFAEISILLHRAAYGLPCCHPASATPRRSASNAAATGILKVQLGYPARHTSWRLRPTAL